MANSKGIERDTGVYIAVDMAGRSSRGMMDVGTKDCTRLARTHSLTHSLTRFARSVHDPIFVNRQTGQTGQTDRINRSDRPRNPARVVYTRSEKPRTRRNQFPLSFQHALGGPPARGPHGPRARTRVHLGASDAYAGATRRRRRAGRQWWRTS